MFFKQEFSSSVFIAQQKVIKNLIENLFKYTPPNIYFFFL